MAANDWLRLWHDMPNDPKWRTVARASGQSISLVISVYVHLLVDASRNVTRGHADVTNEDIASALDVTEDAVQSIRDAMQGRVLDDNRLTGWEIRQPKREDAGNPESGAKSSAQRKREQRERQKTDVENVDVTTSHDESRDVTKSHDREDKRREEKEKTLSGEPDRVDAKAILDYLNAEAGREYRAVDSNLRLIDARLKSGATVEQCKAVIDVKVAEWTGTDQDKYLRPETLFGSTKFEQYVGQLSAKPAKNDFFVPEGKRYVPGVGFVEAS